MGQDRECGGSGLENVTCVDICRIWYVVEVVSHKSGERWKSTAEFVCAHFVLVMRIPKQSHDRPKSGQDVVLENHLSM